MTELPEEDLVLVVDYVDGRLGRMEAIDFERRLSEEPELADAVRSFAGIDRLQWTALEHARSKRASWRLRLFVPIAAAAAVALVWGVLEILGRGEPLAVRSAVVAAGRDLRDHNLVLDLPPDFLPVGEGVRSTDEEVSAREYVARARSAEERLVESALGSPAPEVRSFAYNLVLAPERTCSALVLSVDQVGRARLELPGDARRYAGDRRHLLPQEPLVLVPQENGVDRVEHRPGFLLRSGSTEVTAILAFREAALDVETASALEALIARYSEPSTAATAERALLEWLDVNCFSVRRFRVTEPD